MSMTFTKLFGSITESTIWSEPAGTRLVWITMLAKADRHGRVFASVPGLSHTARVSIEETLQALETLTAPDSWSRTTDKEGRRIEVIDGGWRLINHAKYRAIRDEESMRECKREHMSRIRAEKKAASCGVSISTVDSFGVNAESDADADTEAAEEKTKQRARPAEMVLPCWLQADVWKLWHDYRNARKGWTVKARELSLKKLTELHAAGQTPLCVIEQSIEAGWTQLFPLRVHATSRSHSVRRPRVNDDFSEAVYEGTPEHLLPPELREDLEPRAVSLSNPAAALVPLR